MNKCVLLASGGEQEDRSNSQYISKCKSKEPRSVEQNVGVTLLPCACVKDISVSNCFEVEDHYEFTLVIKGTTRFMYPLLAFSKCTSYTQAARYSSLLALHKTLKRELAPYLKAGHTKMPSFPGKAIFSSGRRLAEKRVVRLNAYFVELFNKYSTLMLYSPGLIDFFEPRRIDVSMVCSGPGQCEAYMKALVYLVTSMKVVRETRPDECELDLATSPKDLLAKLYDSHTPTLTGTQSSGVDFCWATYVPFDFSHNGALYRIDVQNLYSSHCECEAQSVANLYQTSGSACIFTIDLNSKATWLQVKKTLGDIKLFLTEGGIRIPPFILLALGYEQTKHEVQSVEVLTHLYDLFGDPCPYRYIEVSHVTGHNMMESLRGLIETVAKVAHSR